MSNTVTSFFDAIAGNMLQLFEGWDTHVPHAGEKGGVRERRVRDFLEQHLPLRYGVGSGHIIDRNGHYSLQEDVVIYDRINCPVLRADPYYQIFPCESVYATIEVKSTLDSGEIEKCLAHTNTLRQLNRGDGNSLGLIENFVFAYSATDSKRKAPANWALDTFREKSKGYKQPKPVPSLVLCLKEKFVLHLGGPDGKSVCIPDMLESGILLYFFEKLLHRLSQVQTTSPPLFTQYGWEKGNPIRRSRNVWNLAEDT